MPLTKTKRIQNLARLGRKGDPLGIVQNTNKGYIFNSEYVLENDTHKVLWDFEMQTDYPISARIKLSSSNKKKPL